MHVITHGIGHRGQVSAVMLLNSAAPAKDGFTTYLHETEASTRRRTPITPDALELEPVWLNGSPAIQFVIAGQRDGVGTMLVEDGLVTQLFLVRNPDKLGSVAGEVPLSRS